MKVSAIDKGTFVCANFTEGTLDAIQDLQRSLNLLNPTPREKLHTTIIYSRVQIPYIGFDEVVKVGESGWLELWNTQFGKTLVLKYDSPVLTERWKYGMILGATYDFPEYKPHITLAYDVGVQNIAELGKMIDIDIVMESETVKDLDLNWKPDD